MDFSNPAGALTPTLDGAVLSVLATTGQPVTVGDIARRAGRGTDVGIRRCVTRLVAHGTVVASHVGRNTVYQLNEHHVAFDIARTMGDLRFELVRRMTDLIKKWRPSPVLAVLFGSAARMDGSVESDIDLLLVHPPLDTDGPAELASADELVNHLMEFPASPPASGDAWSGHIEDLAVQVLQWSGNHLDVVDVSIAQWLRMKKEPIGDSIKREGVQLIHAGKFAPLASLR